MKAPKDPARKNSTSERTHGHAAQGSAKGIQKEIKKSELITAPKRFEVAVFPLLNTVLFPGVSLPLHIFEKRYEKMLKDIEAKGLPLAISLVTPNEGGREEDDEYSLSLICGAGPVEVFKEYPEGKWDILVHGEKRVRLCNVIQQHPYFVMDAELVEPDTVEVGPEPTRSPDELAGLVKTWLFLNPSVSDELSLLVDQFDSVGDLTDFFVFHFLKRAEDKQVYLNCSSSPQRAEMLARFLETDLVRLSRKLNRSKNSLLIH